MTNRSDYQSNPYPNYSDDIGANRVGGGITSGQGSDFAATETLAPPATLPEDFAADLPPRTDTMGMAESYQPRSDPSSGGSSGEGGASQAASTAKEQVSKAGSWIEQHPMLAVGAGLIGGFVLGSRGGGGDRHQSYSQGYPPAYRPSHIEGSSVASRSASGQMGGMTGGLMGMAQKTGLTQTLQDAADGMMRSANDRATSTFKERVPGFEDQLRQREQESRASDPSKAKPMSSTKPSSSTTSSTKVGATSTAGSTTTSSTRKSNGTGGRATQP